MIRSLFELFQRCHILHLLWLCCFTFGGAITSCKSLSGRYEFHGVLCEFWVAKVVCHGALVRYCQAGCLSSICVYRGEYGILQPVYSEVIWLLICISFCF